MAEPSPSLLWSIVPIVSAISLAFGVITPIITTHTIAYIAAPREISTFVDAVESSVQENENYNCDVAKVSRLEDKWRKGGTTLRITARMLWAEHRKQLEDRVRRLDMLRMRFLVIFMGVITTGERAKDAARTAPKEPEKPIPPAPPPPPPAPRPGISKAYSEGNQQTPSRRLTTQTMGYSEKTEHTHRSGWFGVVAELQRSPILRQRHASIEAAMRSPTPLSPMGSPLSGLRPIKETSIPESLELL
ncbi:hypothetical protein O1611_g9740 [Lasiodiplodia mahajangana]|uniref:Uncharacterized protein n=1 Tax=Lasiodiplodia mahajangana TaxID=1108764 RepID=A0ACC2J672_9PEZI|nr:hypothetical protein O1611_g9740 [Lasiodiplodia mahajangana]